MEFSKPRRKIGDPVSPPAKAPHFEPVPQPPSAQMEMPLSTVLPGVVADATRAGGLVFHCVGDTGGIHGTEVQEAIATAMEAQIGAAAAGKKPAFFYHLGDVVYYNGMSTDYVPQFYEPYQYYPGPVFAIPGNHDGDTRTRKGDAPDGEPSLYGFFKNFCTPVPDDYFKHRPTMTQPYCYWTLVAPFMRIVGLYSNVDGQLDAQQQLWLRQQLRACPADKWLLIGVHHPCFSLDSMHGGYGDILQAIDGAAKAAGRWPDAVLSGHVHDYQRFSRDVGNGDNVPYIVAGAGGYANIAKRMHQLQKELERKKLPINTTRENLRLESHNCKDPGYLRVSAGKSGLSFEYFVVPFDGEPAAEPFDSVTVETRKPKTP